MGGLVPRTDSIVLGGVPSPPPTWYFLKHVALMTISDLLAPSESFHIRVTAPVVTVDRCPDHGRAFAYSRQRFRFDFIRTHQGRHGLSRGSGCSDDSRPIDSFLMELHTGERLLRDRWPDRVRPCLAWLCATRDAKPSSDRISTRTRRRTATATGNAPPAVDYGFGPGGAHRPPARRAKTPPRVPRPRPAPPTAATPATVASAVHTVPIPSDRDCGESVRTPLLRLPLLPGDTSAALTKLDALSDAADL